MPEDYSGQDLHHSDFSGQDLRWANLSGPYLRGANLEDANLSGADLTGAFRRPGINRADLAGVKGLDSIIGLVE